MRIGQVAELLDVPVHVLRHWGDVGAVVPDRAPTGHRVYTEEHLYRLRVLGACQAVGMSLAQIRQILHRDEAGRAAVIEEQLLRIRAQQVQLASAEQFLTHVVDCTHDLLSRCPTCGEYAEMDHPEAATAGPHTDRLNPTVSPALGTFRATNWARPSPHPAKRMGR